MGGAEKAKERLIKFHEQANLDRGLDAGTARTEAEKSAKRDFDSLNPAALASGGKKPTEAEYNTVLSAMTSE